MFHNEDSIPEFHKFMHALDVLANDDMAQLN